MLIFTVRVAASMKDFSDKDLHFLDAKPEIEAITGYLVPGYC